MSEPRAILDEAVALYNPSHVFAMFSGGYDSLVATHITAQHPRFSGVVHINTGIGIEQTRVYVRETCAAYGWPLKEYHAAENRNARGKLDPQIYAEMVKAHGFPGPHMHNKMYSRLKQRCIQQLVRDHKQHKHDRILLVGGIRRQESERRKERDAYHRYGCTCWCSPCIEKDKRWVLDYKREHGLPTNMVVQNLHLSGECLCGAFAKEGELALIEAFYPEVGAYIRQLEAEVRAAGFPWGWEEKPPEWWSEQSKGQEALFDFMPLCSSCTARNSGGPHA